MTTTRTYSINEALNEANPGNVADVLRKLALGRTLKKIKATIAAITATATPDITAIAAAKITINQGPDDIVASGVLPPIDKLVSLRVTAVGTGATGDRTLTDSGGTAAAPPTATAYAGAAVGLAKLSDDGKTLTFEGTVTGFVIEYFAPAGLDLVDGVWTVVNDINNAF